MSITIDEVLEFVKKNDVKFIRLAFCDLLGTQKNISIMPNELKRAFEKGIPFDASSIIGFGGTAKSDLFLVPDPTTMNILPWRPQQGRVIRFYCDIKYPDGSPFIYDARTFLKETMDELAKKGYGCRIGVESEFYLFLNDENGKATDIPIDNGTYLDIAPIDKGENIRREICLCLEDMGILPETSHHETGPGQNEIDIKFADALTTADNFLTLKNVIGVIAERNGLSACFLPKPIPGQSGNGLHINISLFENGINMYESNKQIVDSFMAGIMKRIKEITIFLNLLPSSYERFGSYEAPKFITWSRENRSQLIRIPAATGFKQRFELRSPDSCINPYLAFAILISAGIEGIQNNEQLPEAADYDMKEMEAMQEDTFSRIPESFDEAVSYAKESQFLSALKKKIICDRFLETIVQN